MPFAPGSMKKRFLESDLLKVTAVVAATLLMGAGVAGATISSVPRNAFDPALRPLTIGTALHVSRAYGPDDEDCLAVSRSLPRPDGTRQTISRVVCPDD